MSDYKRILDRIGELNLSHSKIRENFISDMEEKIEAREMSRGEYLKQKKLLMNLPLSFSQGLSGGSYSERELKRMMSEYYPGLILPQSLVSFFCWREMVSYEAVGYFGAHLSSISIGGNTDILEGIDEGLYPEEFKNFFVLGEYEKHKTLGVFLSGELSSDKPVLLMDIMDRSFYKVSNSVSHFLRRGFECAQGEVVQDYFSPSKVVHGVISSIDGESVLPNMEEGVSRFSFDGGKWLQFI